MLFGGQTLAICFFCLFCSIFILLSQESDGGAKFWTNPHPLRVVHFQVFRLFLRLLITENLLAACSKPPCRDNHRKAPYPRTQQRVR